MRPVSPNEQTNRQHALASMCRGFIKADRLPECRLCESGGFKLLSLSANRVARP